jgi:hypothetical protein
VRRWIARMNRIGIGDEVQIRSGKPWYAVAGPRCSRDAAGRVRGLRSFGGRDGGDGGALLEGAAALQRRPAPAGRLHPSRPGARREHVASPPPPAALQAPRHLPVGRPPTRENAWAGSVHHRFARTCGRPWVARWAGWARVLSWPVGLLSGPASPGWPLGLLCGRAPGRPSAC